MGHAELLGFWFGSINTFFFREEGGGKLVCLNGSDNSRLMAANSYSPAMTGPGLLTSAFSSCLLVSPCLLGPEAGLGNMLVIQTDIISLCLSPTPTLVYSPEGRLTCKEIYVAKCDKRSDEIPGSSDLD